MNPITITIANQKGGVAKTTTVVTVGHGLALKGKEALIVDLDSQGHCASALGLEQEGGVYDLLVTDKPLRDVARTTGRKNLFLLPGNKRTQHAQTLITLEYPNKMDVLLTALEKRFQDGGPEYVIIDTSPGIGKLQEMALWAADLVIIPSATDNLSTDGVTKIAATLENLRKQGWAGKVLGILPTFYDEVTRESQAVMDDLRNFLGPKMLLDPIHRATIMRECSANGKTVFEWAPTSRAAEEYAKLVWKVLKHG